MDFMKKITEISKKVGDVATDTYNTVADKSGKIFEEAKLKMNISTKQDEIDEIYQDMGRTVYDEYLKGEDVGKVFTKESKKVDKIKAEIDNMNKKILLNKGLRTCEKCGEVIPKEAGFCAKCGVKQKPVKIKEDKKTEKKEEVKEEKKERVCPQCGNVESSEDNFCMKCGYKF